MKIFILLVALAFQCVAQKDNVVEKIIPGDVLLVQLPYNGRQRPYQKESFYIVPKSGHVDLGKGIGITQVKGMKVSEVYLFLKAFYPKIKGEGVEEIPKKVTGLNVQKFSCKEIKEQNQVILIGGLAKGEVIAFKKGMTLAACIEKWGGDTNFTALNRITIAREGKVLTHNMKNGKTPFVLQLGDVVLLPMKRWVGR